jgi:hypothetical protein
MNKSKNKKEETIEIDTFYLEKENRRKKREINKKKKDKYKKQSKWN